MSKDGTPFVPLTDDLVSALKLYRLRSPRDSGRMHEVQHWACTQLERHGICPAQIEVRCTGAYRDKKWDVAVVDEQGQAQVAISTKTIVSNHGGSIPNRIDDMVGEAVNMHRLHPRAVLGYLAFMHTSDDSRAATGRIERAMDQEAAVAANRANAVRLFPTWTSSVQRASGRVDVDEPAERWEAACVMLLDLDDPAQPPLAATSDLDTFFSIISQRHAERFG